MQSQEYGDTLFNEAVAGLTATGFNTCLRHCLLNHHQVFSTSWKGRQAFLSEESVRVLWCFADLRYTRRRESSLSCGRLGRWARRSTFLGSSAEFIRQQVSRIFHKFPKTVTILGIHDLHMLTHKNFLSEKANEELMHLTAAIKITCHNNFHSGEIMKDYNNETFILNKFNLVMMAIKTLNSMMRKYRTQIKRIMKKNGWSKAGI